MQNLNNNNFYKNNKSLKFTNSGIKKIKILKLFCTLNSHVLRNSSQKLGNYDENLEYAQDYDLWWKLTTLGEVGNLNEKLLILRQKNSISVKIKIIKL